MLPKRVPLAVSLFLFAGALLCAQQLVTSSPGSRPDSESFAVQVPAQEKAKESRFATETTSRSAGGTQTADGLLRMIANADYGVLPGDVYSVTVVYYSGGSDLTQQMTLRVPLEADYTVYLPFVGPLDAKGMSYAQLRTAALSKIRKSVAVQFADMSIASLAVFRVFVSGAVAQPGFVVVDGLARVSDAIDLAGGALEGASLRRVSLRSKGAERTVDLLLFASARDRTSNPMLYPGDSLHIPAASTGAVIEGRVRYPGRYELVEGETLADLVQLAGGFAAGADERSIGVSRVDEARLYIRRLVDFATEQDFPVRDGDVVLVPSAAENAPMVIAEGALFGQPLDPTEPASVTATTIVVQLPYSPGSTVLGVLDQLGGPTPYAATDGSYLLREATGEKMPFDAGALWKSRDRALDLPLEPGDRIVVPQKTLNVAVWGEVLGPGLRGWVEGYTIADYVRASGGVHPTRGSLSRLRIATAAGKTIRGTADFQPAPGDTIRVGKRPLAAVTDFFGSYVFPVTAVLVGILTVANGVWDFIDRIP